MPTRFTADLTEGSSEVVAALGVDLSSYLAPATSGFYVFTENSRSYYQPPRNTPHPYEVSQIIALSEG